MRTMSHRRMCLTIAVVIALTLIASGCSGSATTTLTESAAGDVNPPNESEPSAQAAPTQPPEPTAAPVATTEPTAAPEPTAELAPVYFGSDLQVGDCFSRLTDSPSFQPPDMVACDDFHQQEVYAKLVLDDPAGAPYPGDDPLASRVSLELCDDATITFAGAPWDEVPFSSQLIYPNEEEWMAGDRIVLCTAQSHRDDTLKIGTAAGGTLDTNDVLVARAALNSGGVDFHDWSVFGQYGSVDTVGSLTDGQFDLPLRRPFVVPQGFIFNARAAGDEGHATTTWGYNWTTGEFTDLGSILPGQEIASTLVASGVTIFASRANPGDDFDLWSTASGDAEILIGGDGHQQYPTLTPDQSKLVYQDNGDIWVANIDGTNPLQLTSGPANDYESIVSPDGGTVVFASDRSGNDDLWAIDIGGGEPVNLTSHPADESWPVFSDNGEYLYFSSDRLDPEADRSRVMVMSPDGSNQSWFANTGGGMAIVVPEAYASQVLDAAPSLNERFNYELIEGEPGTTTTWAHSNGRLVVDLPAGWRVGEFDELSGFLAGPRPDRYYDTWNVDGVNITLWDGETQESFFAIYEGTEAVQSCEQYTGTDGIVPISEGVVGISANFNCGEGGAVGGVIAVYNSERGVGVIMEGQRDNLPDADLDTEMLAAIAASLVWE